jgi:hypothetical protein
MRKVGLARSAAEAVEGGTRWKGRGLPHTEMATKGDIRGPSFNLGATPLNSRTTQGGAQQGRCLNHRLGSQKPDGLIK